MAIRRSRVAALTVVGALALAGLAASAQAASGTTLKLSASPSALKFSVTKLSVAKPGKVTIVMSNPSSISHSIALKGNGLKKPVVGPIVGKGKTSTISTTVKKGTYTFYCSVPGHAQAGMKGTLTVK